MRSRWLVLLLMPCILLIPLCIDGAPPNRETADDLQNAEKQQKREQERREKEEAQKKEIAKYVKYMGYLESVLTILQSTPQWREAMQSMTQEEMRVGKIAEMVDKLEPHVIEQLAKTKVQELQRLEQEIKAQLAADGGSAQNIKVPQHLDFNNWETFSKEDLRRLVVKTVADMDELERQRRQNFKEYEMKKKAEEDHRAAKMSQAEREQYLRQMEEQRRRHNEHERLKHPGSRDQLEEAWEDTDKLDKDAYDPRTFFALHDLDNDGYWNYDELNTIFLSEVEKIYNTSNSDDDPNERLEEIYRMREHVMKQMDKNNDRRISLEEFLEDAEAQDKKPDQGWEDIGDKEQYTKEDLEQFEREYAKQQGWGEYAYSTPAPTPIPAYQPGNMPVQQSGNVPVQQPNMPIQQPGNVPMQQPGNVPMQQPGNVPMQQPGNVPMQQPGNVPVQQPGVPVEQPVHVQPLQQQQQMQQQPVQQQPIQQQQQQQGQQQPQQVDQRYGV